MNDTMLDFEGAPPHMAERTRVVMLMLPEAIFAPLIEQQSRRETERLPYASLEELLELWIVDQSLRQHMQHDPQSEPAPAEPIPPAEDKGCANKTESRLAWLRGIATD